MSVEHVNLTVRDARTAADFYERVFGWHTRWEGPALHNGYTVHVGDDSSYLALFSHGGAVPGGEYDPSRVGLNHVGVVVDDLDAVEAKVLAEGITTQNHASYDPGERFYFNDPDGIEVEVVSYTDA